MAPRQALTGFTTDEVANMERMLKNNVEQSLNAVFFKKVASGFNKSKSRRLRKTRVKWTEVQNWFETQRALNEEADRASEILMLVREACLRNGSTPKGKKVKVQKFEAKSRDKAWYDVDMFVRHRNLNSDDAKVLVRFSKYGKDDDEWVEVVNGVRKRSIGLNASECNLVEVGATALYYLVESDAKRYFQVEILGIQRLTHNSRTCGCTFTVRYTDDDNEEYDVPLESLYFQPSILHS